MLNTATLAQIVIMVRAEAGHSLSAAQGQNTIDTIKALIQRTQIELWTAYQWPTLKLRQDTSLSGGQYLYDFSSAFTFEQVRETWVSRSDSYNWTVVTYGIAENLIAPSGGNSQFGDNIQFWDVSGQTKFRIWPTPISSKCTLRFIGQQQPYEFLDDADMSTIDATAISLFVAAELLARAKAEDAPIKLQKAQKYLLSLLGNSISAKRRISTLASGAPIRRGAQATPYLDYIPTTN